MAPAILCSIFEEGLTPASLAQPKMINTGAAADLEALGRSVQISKIRICDAGLGNEYQIDLGRLDRQVMLIHYLLLEKYEPKSAPRAYKKRILKEGQRLKISQGSADGLETPGEIVLFKLGLLLQSDPQLHHTSTDRVLHQYRKSIFSAIRLMIKHDLVKNRKRHPVFQNTQVAQLLWRCGLIEDKIKPPESPSVLPTLFSDRLWHKVLRGFKTKKFQEATINELKRVSQKVQYDLKFQARPAIPVKPQKSSIWQRIICKGL
ncbi:hypothetical protein PGT21_015108 [Puccinia graminis f. sp. tritici]|uniref:Uncharacterized protein n=1 Tax=Puccinia graminis f. sp. tritici TaxID=56615 RepID=A0A5B0N568_PUCGR|nr:hypothetical protein PGTUg99_020161 [Puccinia graminis f. sp. tritici]KAA1094253.1 hypothetical protein PGT21_015108 [Puccinia graminis f. sp. tritici]